MRGVVNTRIWPRYEGSVMDSVSAERSAAVFSETCEHVHEVIDVEKTVSAKMLFGAPKERPVNDCPDLRCRTPGTVDACVAMPRKPL